MYRYSGGNTENPTYREVCSGQTNHNEVVQVVYHPDKISYSQVLKVILALEYSFIFICFVNFSHKISS